MKDKGTYSRREFLKKASVVFGGGIFMTVLAGKLLGKLGRRSVGPQEFPDGSIYSPAKKNTEL